jgi:hypothetical protein
MEMKKILLGRLWDGHPAGSIVEVEDYTADSMVRKGYGEIYKHLPKKNPNVETADAPPSAERAVVTPELPTKGKTIIEAQIQGEKDSESKRGRKAGK